jgi:hypothetical protein
MLALGLNPALLHERKPMTRRAYDDTRLRRFGGDAEQMSVNDGLQAVRDLIANCEDPDALTSAICDELSQATGVGEPEPGSREAEDRRRKRAMGLDSRQPRPDEERAFLGRFKDAARIQVM